MPATYAYTARSETGAFVAGTLAAESSDRAFAHLRARALFVTSLEASGTLKGLLTSTLSLRPVGRAARVTFFRSFATMIASGVPVRRALEVAIDECRDARLTEALASVASDIENGMSLSLAMGHRPREFPPLFIALVRAGELAGLLDEALERLAQLLERDRALRMRVGSALAYPAIVTIAAVGIIMFLIANTVPAFATMFAEIHASLPLSTRVLILIGGWLHSPFSWLLLGLVPIAAALSTTLLRKTSILAERFDRLLLALPVLGSIFRKVAVARFARTLGTLLRSGVALIPALENTRDVLELPVYRCCIDQVKETLRDGEPFASTLALGGLFDSMFLQLVRAGEETGTLDVMLTRAADYYELEVETMLATLGSIVEPVLIVVLGAIVGAIVASILIPLYSIIGSIK